MSTRGRSGKNPHAVSTEQRGFRLAPIAHAIALALAAGGVIGNAYAAQPFSQAWYGNKSAIQNTAAATGLLPNGQSVSSLNPQVPQQRANALAQQSIANLSLAAHGIAAMQAAQAAARQAAMGGVSNVPDGLGAGGLDKDTNSLTQIWLNAQDPTQTVDGNGKVTVSVKQNSPQSVLSWQSFNVGRNTTLHFDQTGGSQADGSNNWTVLNRVSDPSGVPSSILGAIRAEGQVLLINRNGIIFGGSSQINVRSLVASSLNLNDTYATDTSKSNYLNGKGFLSDGTQPSFFSTDSSGIYSAGPVTVQAGAQIAASGGAVLLLAPTVQNDGAIVAPAGQALLFGGSDIMLNTGDSFTRGFIVAPNPLAPNPNNPGSFYAATTPGSVINNGSISASRGNITIVAGSIAENGVLTATTSTTGNGSINVQAQSGNLAMGGINDDPLYAAYGQAPQSSLIQILPDPTDQAMVTDTQAIANSSISLGGSSVDIKGIVQLHGYDITNASDHPGGIAITAFGTVDGSGVSHDGSVLLEAGSILDASGTTDASASASRNSVAVELRVNELRDSPLVEAGPLYQKTIYVDASASGTNADGTIWHGTPLADASPWIALTGRSLEERMMNGAPITIGGSTNGNSSGAAQLVQTAGSDINVSGGYLSYTPGFVQVSTLLTADGARVTATNANPNVVYAGLCCSFTINHPRWNATETFRDPLVPLGYMQPGYIQGGAGGSLMLNVSAAVLNGTIDSSVVVGEKQRTPATAPPGASLIANSLNIIATRAGNPFATYNAESIILSDTEAATAAGWAAGFDVGTDLNTLLMSFLATFNSVYIPSAWLNSGFTTINLGANNAIRLPAGNNVNLPAGGSVSASANTVEIASSISAPDGTIALTGAYTADSTLASNLNGAASVRSGLVTLGAGVTLSAAGLWTNVVDGGSGAPVNGGAITIGSYGDIDLGLGTVLDVSGGGSVSVQNKVTGGNGGKLSLTAGLVPANLPVPVVSFGTVKFAGGALAPGQFRGYGTVGTGVGKGGTLNLTTSDVVTITPASQMGGVLADQLATAADAAGNPYSPLLVSTDFFSAGGFAGINLTATGIDLPAGVVLAPTVASQELVTASASPSIATVTLPSGIRQAASVGLDATGDLRNRGGAISGYQNAVDTTTYSLNIAGTIKTDPTGSVTLKGEQVAIVSGTVDAPGGNIALGGGTYRNLSTPPGALMGEGVWLTGTGQLLAAGIEVAVPQSNGAVYDDVLPGGQVTVSGGAIILEPGSIVDVSGASGQSTSYAAGFGLAAAGVNSLAVRPALTTTSFSPAGTISIDAVLGAVLEGTLSGNSGGGAAAGGTLNISLAAHGGASSGGPGPGTPADYWPAVENTYLIVQQTLQPGDSGYLSSAQIQPGADLGSLPIDATIRVSAKMVGDGGFASMALSAPSSRSPDATDNLGYGFLTFAGNASLVLPNQLLINTGTIIVPNGALETLQANYVQWNNTGLGAAEPTAGTGILSIDVQTIDLIGDLAVQGARLSSFNAADDLRLTGVAGVSQLTGSLASAGDLVFSAGQIYPSTQTEYTLASATRIGFVANGALSVAPLSAGGVLNVYAPEIDQSGTLRAPNGAINLGSQTAQTFDGITDPFSGLTSQNVAVGATTILNLGAGSLTSVAADGEAVLFGSVQNGTAWSYNVNAAPTGTTVSAPPAKTISLSGTNVSVTSGAVIDASGGGDLFAGEFVPGTGGSRNIFAGPNVYAVIPGYTGITPYDPETSAAGPSVGRQVYLNGMPGLPAGFYTLLPGQYAELPNAFRVTVQTTSATARGPFSTTAQTDGSYTASGYFVTPGTGTTDQHWSAFQVMSDPVARKYSEIGNYYANTFFPDQAAAAGIAVPRLPQDAGQLSINALKTLDFQGAGRFTPGTGGLGGIADISANQILVVDAATRDSIGAGTTSVADYIPGGMVGSDGEAFTGSSPEVWNPIVLAAGDLDRFGVESLLLGGSRTFQNDGVHITAQASQVVVANDARDKLVLPDIQLIASPTAISHVIVDPIDPSGGVTIVSSNPGTGQVIIAPNAVIEASGAVAPGEASHYVLAPSEQTAPSSELQGGSVSYDTTDVTNYYQAAVKNQIAYVRLSGGGLATTERGIPTYAGLPTVSGTSSDAIANWWSAVAVNSTITVNTDAASALQFGQEIKITGSAGQTLIGRVSAITGTAVNLTVQSTTGNGASTGENIVGATFLSNAAGTWFFLPTYSLGGSVVVGSGAQLTSDNSLTLFASSSGTIAAGVAIAAQAAEFKSTQINLGTIDAATRSALQGLILDQPALDGLSGVKGLTLISSGTIDLYGGLNLGEVDGSGQPILGNLTFDSAGLVEKGASGTATFTAEQVTFQNTLGGSVAPTAQIGGAALSIIASDVLGNDLNGTVTGFNNGKIIFGAGAVTLAGFGAGVTLQSSGEIVAAGDGGALNIQSALTLDAPQITAGSVILPQAFTTDIPQYNTAAYTITAADNAAAPGNWYAVNLTNSSGAAPALPQAVFGNSLTINAAETTIATSVVLPGGVFAVNANGGGSITVGSRSNANGTIANGMIDVSGRSFQFVDVLATIGGGNITLSTPLGAIAIQPGAVLDVGDLAGVGALNQTSAGTLTLSASTGGVTIAAGTLHGEGVAADSAGSFILDTNTLATAAQTYDALASVLVAGGFGQNWDIRARSGDIAMSGLTQARNVTVSTDTGNIDVAGTIDASGASGGKINLYAGNNLTLESSAVLNAHGAIADASGRGGQIWLAADAADSGTGFLILNRGAAIDVGADTANGIDSGPVLGGQLTLSTARNSVGNGAVPNLNLSVNGGTLANFLGAVKGESAWDGIVVVGNQVYNYNDTTLILTPTTSVAASGGVETVAFKTYLDDAASFMGHESAIWAALGADGGSGVAGGILVNIRPGITIKNSGGDITLEGDATNMKGIDLSGSAYSGSVLNTGDPQTLIGHFGQYDEPVVLAIRAGGNLNFGSYTDDSANFSSYGSLQNYLQTNLHLGTLSDGFSQYSDGLGGAVALGAGASAWAAPFDPAASNNGQSGGLGASSATFFLAAGADVAAADPLKTKANAVRGTLTVAGVVGEAAVNETGANVIFPVTTDPLYLYNYSWSGGNSNTTFTDWLGGPTQFTDYASLVRTGTGAISIATAKDLDLQSPLSLIYTAGVGYNVNGTGSQPLSGFTQYSGMMALAGTASTTRNNIDYLPASTFLTHGGDVQLAIGGNITGDMNATVLLTAFGATGITDENLPYDMTALGSQLKLQNFGAANLDPSAPYATGFMGAFNGLYATDAWMQSNTVANQTYYTLNALAPASSATPGDYQLAWYNWFPYLENTIGSFGGGNIAVKAGGSVAHVQFVAPTNARDAGPVLVAGGYDPATQTGLYVQGGGNVSVQAGGNLTDVYTYVQNGTTALQTGGSASELFLAGATGDISVQARGTINISDKQVQAMIVAANQTANSAPWILSGISLIQNASIVTDLIPYSINSRFTDQKEYLPNTVLTGILTSPPTGSLTLNAVGSVTLDVNDSFTNLLRGPSNGISNAMAWNTNQGLLPAQVNLISLGGDVINQANFIAYPDPHGTVNLLARGTVELEAGFVLSDAAPSVMPTLENIAALLSSFQTVVDSSNFATAALTPSYDRLIMSVPAIGSLFFEGGAHYLAGQDTGLKATSTDIFGSVSDLQHPTVLGGDGFGQLIRDVASPLYIKADPVLEAQRHAGLHAGDLNPARIVALNGDVAQPTPAGINSPFQALLIDPYLDLAKAVEIYAGRDVKYLTLIGQNNNAADITSIVAGRDVIYPALTAAATFTTLLGIDIAGPGNVILESGRNVDLGTSTGVQTIGNFLTPALQTGGAGITILTGLGSALAPPDYTDFAAQYVNPAGAAQNQYAEPLQLFDANGKPIGDGAAAYAYLQTLSPQGQGILLDRVFFDLVRDSGREHNGADASPGYGMGATSIDTAGVLDHTFANYQRAFAVIGTFLPSTSGKGSFLGGLSTVRTLDGGNITIMSPHGQIQAGLIAPPADFPGYSDPNNPIHALSFGIVTEKGGDVDLYADGNISVNQSRVFTLEGGDMTVVSRSGDIDAGKGAKTVQAIQPPNVSYDAYGNVTITPYGPSSGSGLAVLRALPEVPPSNADLIAFVGNVDAGDAGVRVSGNINIAAVQVLNAGNIQVQGKSTGIPVIAQVNVGALTNASAAATQAAMAAQDVVQRERTAARNNLPSIFTVRVLGFGNEPMDGSEKAPPPRTEAQSGSVRYDPSNLLQLVGNGKQFDPKQVARLTDEERQALQSR